MTDVIKAMRNAYDHRLQMIIKPLPSEREEAMRAAIAALADNVSDEMCDAATRSMWGPAPDMLPVYRERFRASINRALRSLLQNE